MITREELVNIGRFVKPHGIHGEVQAALQVDPDDIATLRCLVADIDGIFVPFFINECRQKAGHVLLTIDGICSDNDAAMIADHDAFALKTDYRNLQQRYHDDSLPIDFFIGFRLLNHDDNQPVGTIHDVDDTTANVLFLVTTDNGNSVAVPAAEPLITDIDTQQRTITMQLPDGLLQINLPQQ